MKKGLLYFLSIMFLSACGRSPLNAYYSGNKGEIVKVEHTDDTVLILVSFASQMNVKNYITFYGSDTCKVGQILTLK